MTHSRSTHIIFASAALLALGVLSAFGCTSASETRAPDLPPQLAPTITAQSTSVAPASATLSAEMQDYLDNQIDKTAVRHSFHAHEGIWVDCVDILKQPAMKSPAMQGKPIATPPPRPTPYQVPGTLPGVFDGEVHASENDENGKVRHCPDGTVPIKRVTSDELLRFPSLEAFLSPVPTSADSYDHATQFQYVSNWGLKSTLSLWNPYVEAFEDTSVSQLWVINNTGPLTESVEAGWMVHPHENGDYNARLFVLATWQNWQLGKYCFDTHNSCPWMQYSTTIYPGMMWSAYSVNGGAQYAATFEWYLDFPNGNWWLLYENQWIGYFPPWRFTNLQFGANEVKWGGEVHNSEPGGHYTNTDMGSGQFAQAGWTHASWQQHIQYHLPNTNYGIDTSGSYTDPFNSSCWTLLNIWDNGHGIYFGGGGNSYPGCQ